MISSHSSNRKIKRRSARPKKHSRLLELIILAVFALVIIYGASFALKISNGVSKTVDMPVETIRVQLLNGCGVQGAANAVARAISSLVQPPLDVDVVEVYDFKAYDVRKCFLISRSPELGKAVSLARALGLDADNIVYEPIENNYRSIDVTLVLGTDYVTVFKPSK
ncbi:MAG: LytR C-terminal domain-containing protein [bacterium]|jgi:hypothetical protein